MIEATLIPAYGRDYKSKAEVLKDFEDGKDFIFIQMTHPSNGRYANKADLLKSGVTEVYIRYDRLTKITPIKVKS